MRFDEVGDRCSSFLFNEILLCRDADETHVDVPVIRADIKRSESSSLTPSPLWILF